MSSLLKLFFFVSLFFILYSCANKTEMFTAKQSAEVKDSVKQMMESISNDVSHDGPVAWVKYLESTPDFYMASEGHLVFTNGEEAANIIKNNVAKQFKSSNLHWSNLRIDPLTDKLANVAAMWHEDMTDIKDSLTRQGGFFTGIAQKTPAQGWQLRNAHWSLLSSN